MGSRPSMSREPQPFKIESGTTYPLREFMKVSGLGRHAMREARRRGLKVRRAGNKAFVLGDDFASYLRSLGEPEPDEAETDKRD